MQLVPPRIHTIRINVITDDWIHLKEIKGKRTWHQFLLDERKKVCKE